jgi:hypothetical protein
MLDTLSVSTGYSQAVKIGYSNQSKGPDNDSNGIGSLLKSLENREGDVLELGRPGKNRLPSPETLLALLEEKVNKNVKAAFPDEEVEKTLSDDYWSPENTASRIVGFATKYWDHYAKKNGGESEEALDSFLSIVEGAINQGFGEASSIIGEANGGSVPEKSAGTIAKTREHVTNLLGEFREAVLARINGMTEQKEMPAPEVTAA